MEKKRKFNVVDVVAVVLIVAVAAFVGQKLLRRGSGEIVPVSTVTVRYTVRCENVDRELYETTQKHIPSQLMASGTLYDGSITGVEMEPYYILSGDGTWVEDRDHVNLLFSVEATIPKADVVTTEIAKQEVRVGKSDYILKSEYIEFKNAVVVDADWIEN